MPYFDLRALSERVESEDIDPYLEYWPQKYMGKPLKLLFFL